MRDESSQVTKPAKVTRQDRGHEFCSTCWKGTGGDDGGQFKVKWIHDSCGKRCYVNGHAAQERRGGGRGGELVNTATPCPHDDVSMSEADKKAYRAAMQRAKIADKGEGALTLALAQARSSS